MRVVACISKQVDRSVTLFSFQITSHNRFPADHKYYYTKFYSLFYCTNKTK